MTKGIGSDAFAVAGSPKKCKYKDPLDLQELEKLMETCYAENSEWKVRWAVKMYSERRLHALNMECSDDHLANADIHNVNTLDKSALCFSLSKFVTEVIKVNREDYPPNTLKELIYSIRMYLHSKRVF